MSIANSTLAILGGERAIPEGTIKNWPPVDDIDRKMVLDSLNSNDHTFGPNCEKFAKEFAAWNGNNHAVVTNSGTAALHMALVGCGVGAGDHVLVPAYSWSSSATCILHHNAIPVFVDIDFDTMNMDLDKIEAAITPRTKAVVCVHLHGLAVDMDKLMAIARKHNLKVVEDACQAHGARFKGQKVGTFGDVAAFSFNQNKCLCSGEGGMCVSDDEEIFKRARQLWSFGETRTPSESRDYHAYALGWMYRGSDLVAAFGRAQLTKLDGYLADQHENALALTEEVQGVRGLILPTEPEGYTHNWYNYTSRIDMDAVGWTGAPARLSDAVIKALSAEGVVGHGVWQRFILPAMTVFQARNAYGNGSPWAENDSMDVDYNPEHFPVAQLHSNTHFGMTVPLRSPNGPDVARAVGQAMRKVFDNIDKLDPDEILKEKE